MRPPAARARRLGWLLAGLAGGAWLALAVACSHGPTWDQFRKQAAGPRPGYARIFVYTPLRSEALGFHPDVALDGEVVGTSSPGTFFLVDREPGVYELTVPPKRYLSAFGNQGASEPAKVSLWLGQSAFVQVDIVELGNRVQARLRTREAGDGERFIRTCRYAAGDTKP
jgi:hypothetical protein